MTVCIQPFQCASSPTSPTPESEPEKPAGFSFVPFSDDQSKTWSQEFKLAKANSSKAVWREIGNLRNGFGMVMSHVYALNDPGVWLADTLKMDLESLGAKVVEASPSDAADVTVSGTIEFCRVDMYMKIWGDLVVDFDLQPTGGTAHPVHLHTEGGTVGWVGSTSEFYHALRECRQKMSWLVTREILKCMSPPR